MASRTTLGSETEDFETTYAGFRVLGLRSPEVELRCAPELGGRLFSLVNRRSGREWLWRLHEVPELFFPTNPFDFGSGCFAGLDECLPTVGACTWVDGRPLADHGDIWARSWDISIQGKGVLALSVSLPSFGLRFSRQIRIEGNTVRFDYELENFGAGEAPALWSMHPLFRISKNDRLQLPAGVQKLHLEAERFAFIGNVEKKHAIDVREFRPGVRLNSLELPSGQHGYLKCFTPALPAPNASVALINSESSDRLEVHWDTGINPYCGLWLTRGGYRNWHHVALEPTNAPYDRVDVAAGDPQCASLVVLAPKVKRKWWVEWRLF
jgi:galactose mutarotase-like enzyme